MIYLISGTDRSEIPFTGEAAHGNRRRLRHMTGVGGIDRASVARGRCPPSILRGALAGAVVVLGFTAVHDVFILDIWSYVGQMLFAGALCGACIAWSYRAAVSAYSTVAWVGYGGLYVVEMIALGAFSLLLLEPQFTMAELLADDDAFDRLLRASIPLLIAAMVVGSIAIWWHYGRRPSALAPIAVTQVVLVFLLGHQFAFLGLVETSASLVRVFGEFAVMTIGLAVSFTATAVGLEVVAGRMLARRRRGA
jgi:hypothetical protein